MTIKIDINHPILQLKAAVLNRCDHFLAQHGFNYFQYLRCYQDGSFSLLTNDIGLLEKGLTWSNSPVIFSSFSRDHEQMHSYWFLWDEELPDAPVALAKNKCNLHHGLTLVRRSKHYYDMIAVALPEPKNNIGAFYLNKQKAIESFINTFDKTNQDLILYINQHSVALPDTKRDINYQKICLPNGRIHVQGKNGLTYLTTQELACIRLYLQGASIKQIAQVLQISPRTVETYFIRIKLRSGITRKSDFQELLITCP
jgi:DNA-binding CsgD family transcriptional regulator